MTYDAIGQSHIYNPDIDQDNLSGFFLYIPWDRVPDNGVHSKHKASRTMWSYGTLGHSWRWISGVPVRGKFLPDPDEIIVKFFEQAEAPVL